VAHTLLAVSPLISLHKSYISFRYKILVRDKFAGLSSLFFNCPHTQRLSLFIHKPLNHAQRLGASQTWIIVTDFCLDGTQMRAQIIYDHRVLDI